ncbi:MAG TPA: hypothetical protein VLH40_06040, partial [Atribacteraceae bacterium]|nr:hypothetical protein [Atribacteraceae bacterium]
MKVSSETLQNFEWEKIVRKLAFLCTGEATRDEVLRLAPLHRFEEVTEALRETGEYLEMIRFDGEIAFSPFPDLREALSRASLPGSTLPLPGLVRIFLFMQLVRRIIAFGRENRIHEKYPHLFRYWKDLPNFSPLRKLFTQCISEDGRVLDTASPGLSQARRTIRRIEESLKETLNSFLNHPDHLPYLQERHYTVRRGRHVVPVKAQARNQVEGLIIDSSSTGATVFVEPRAVLFLNNELEVALCREREEVERVLDMLTGAVRGETEPLERSFRNLTHLDFLQSKARLARDWDALCPELTKGEFSFRRARHPLLGHRAVPFDLTITPDRSVLVVSGPNAGGKTVLIKTIALAVFLTHCGLFPPLERGSQIPFSRGLYVDIGDHQDLENDLSTFTSRITRLKAILEDAGSDTLVLIDELGSGTDPEEGAALARAVLEHLRSHRVTCVVTTHFPSVKHYASQEPGMQTASLEFDPIRLVPTFRLLPGEIGGSFGLEIAARVGFSKTLLDRAVTFLNQERIDLDRLILEQRRKNESLQKMEQELKERLEATALDQEKVASLRAELEEGRRKILREYREELSGFLKNTREEVARLVGALRKDHVLDEETYRIFKTKMEREKEWLQSLDRVEERVASEPKNPEAGDRVYINDLKKGGTVLSVLPEKNRILVEMEGRKIQVSLDKVRRDDQVKPADGESIRYTLNSVVRTVPELEIRKMRVEEAKEKLEKYFD